MDVGASTSRMDRDFDDVVSVGDIVIENDPGDQSAPAQEILGNVSSVLVDDASGQPQGGQMMDDDRQSNHSEQEAPPQDEGTHPTSTLA